MRFIKNTAFLEMSGYRLLRNNSFFRSIRQIFKQKPLTDEDLKKALARHHAEQILEANKEHSLKLARYPWGLM